MRDQQPDQEGSPSGEPVEEAHLGLVAGIAAMATNFLGLFLSRIELAALELAEARSALFRMVLVGALGLLAMWFAIACGVMLIVALAWPFIGWGILLILAVLFLVGAIIAFQHLQRAIASGALGMPATMSELRKDRDVLL
ncbi:MAG: phage holin family protein [Herminiimonas sp.]|nr:phage holin family protein [Herminiimonas sp.]MDB5852267.1 phage holin family protein [Herminiimonas sp.]